MRPPVNVALFACALLLAACGSDAAGGPSLSAGAAAGQEISRSNGCAACHGHDGQGGAGPPFIGLYGSNVALTDGSTVVADDAYLTEATRDPDATGRVGYDVGMPANTLTEEQIASVVAYIRELTIGPQE